MAIEQNDSLEQVYGADQIQVLEGLEAVRKTTWYVYWFNKRKRSSSFSLGNCR